MMITELLNPLLVHMKRLFRGNIIYDVFVEHFKVLEEYCRKVSSDPKPKSSSFTVRKDKEQQ